MDDAKQADPAAHPSPPGESAPELPVDAKAAKRKRVKAKAKSGKPKASADPATGEAPEPRGPRKRAPLREAHGGALGLAQVAALPMRQVDGRTEVCLITTRETHRWTIPKGWPMAGRKDHRAAALEAEQEAGLKGRIGKTAVGTYLSFKRQEAHFDLVTVTVYRLDVTRTLETWREKGQRQIRWVPADQASAMVEETGLQAIIAALA